MTESVSSKPQDAEQRGEFRPTKDTFERFFALSRDMLCVAGTDGYFKWVNTAFEELGYSREELLSRPFLDLVHPEDLPATLAEVERLASGEPTISFENRYRCKDGSLRWLSWSVSPEPSGVLYGIARDVTASHAAREAHARLAAIIESSDDAIVGETESGTVTSWNEGAEKIFGYRSQEAIGQPISFLIPPDRMGEESELLERVFRNERVDHFETVRQRKDGRKIDVSVTLSPVRDRSGKIVGISKIARDISRRKEVEAALVKKNQELEVAARIDHIASRVMVALSKQDETALPAVEILGVLAEDAGYRPLALYQYDDWKGELVLEAALSLAPGYSQKKVRIGEGLVGEAAAGRRAVFVDNASNAPFSLDTGVGILTAATVFAVPLVHREKLLGVIAGAAQKSLLERERSWLTQLAGQVAVGLHAIRQFQELKDLSQLLNERSVKIEAQNRELARASQLKSEFLASMSHELRTPLNAIIGFAEVMKDGLVGEMNAVQLEYAGIVYQSGRHLLSLINDILDLSKIEAGKMELDLEEVDVASLVDDAITIMKERASKGNISLEKSIAPGVATLHADGRKLRQILYNLLSNAVKFTPVGGSVRVEVTNLGSLVEFAVVDTGIGVSTAEQSRLFRAFEQLDGGVARKFEGTGLGLVMVKNLVELHGGTLGVESEVGKGSRFWVRLPASRAALLKVRPPMSMASRLPQRGGSELPRMLVVDDDPAAIALARRWLEKEGYQVDSALRCDDAWAQIRKQPPDAILLDILFENGPDGWAFLEQIRNSPEHKNIPVVVVSILADLEKGMALGALQVLQKPVAGAELLDAIDALDLGPGEPLRVLVVDDDPRSVEYVSKRLEQAGMTVTRAYGGKEALAAVENSSFSAMILDLMMPEVSGFDVVRELRASALTEALPIVILTAKVLEPAERAMLERTVHSVLTKEGWDAGKFVQVIRGAVRLAAQRKHRSPAQQVYAGPQVPTSDSYAPTLSHVLVVDEDPAARDLVRFYLQDAGFIVTASASTADAMSKLGDKLPDLIALNLDKPGVDGHALLAAYRKVEHLKGIPVLVLSSAEKRQEALALGAEAVLTKPIRRHELLEVVRRVLDNRNGRRIRLLIADDDPLVVKVVSSYFAAEPFEVTVASGGRQALNAIRERRPDLLIADLMMVDMSGFDLLAQLRTTPETADLPVIVLTAKELTVAERNILLRDAQMVLSKQTIGRGELVGHVRKFVSTIKLPKTIGEGT